MTTRRSAKASPPAPRRKPRAQAPASSGEFHPRSVSIFTPEDEDEMDPDQPFTESTLNAIDPDLRQRMISETAYRYYSERGYADGYDVDDWLQAEAEVDHVLLNPHDRAGARTRE
jgi:hypothetical protein